MLASARHEIILNQLEHTTTVSIRDLTQLLGVSRETVRKDIDYLAEAAKLQKIRGGATRIRSQEIPMESRAQINISGKRRIANVLADLIPDGSSLFLDNGSSTLAVAQALSQHRSLTVYTNDFAVARQIAPNCQELVFLGGQIDTQEMATIGVETTDQVRQYHADIAVISAGGLSAQALITDFSKDVVSFRAQMLRNGGQRFVIADKEKFGVLGRVAMPVPPKGTCIVTDERPDADVIAAIAQNDLTLRVAGSH